MSTWEKWVNSNFRKNLGLWAIVLGFITGISVIKLSKPTPNINLELTSLTIVVSLTITIYLILTLIYFCKMCQGSYNTKFIVVLSVFWVISGLSMLTQSDMLALPPQTTFITVLDNIFSFILYGIIFFENIAFSIIYLLEKKAQPV